MSVKKLKPPYKWLFLLLLVAAAFFLRRVQQAQPSSTTSNVKDLIQPNARLTFTKHARCRMSCRGITEEEIREVIREGKVNHSKSDKNDAPCPSYAIEDRVQDGQLLRIVFGICDNEIKVITCIDLEQKHDCDCS